MVFPDHVMSLICPAVFWLLWPHPTVPPCTRYTLGGQSRTLLGKHGETQKCGVSVYVNPSQWKNFFSPSYFVVDFEMLRGVRLQEITLGFYSTVGGQPTSSSAPQRQFSLNIGQIKVIFQPHANCNCPQWLESLRKDFCCFCDFR